MQKLLIVICFLIALSGLTTVSFAQESLTDTLCAETELREAKAGLRLQTQLMMAGMMCSPHTEKANLYDDYQALAKQHEAVFTSYEQNIRDAYPEVKAKAMLNTYRTELGNLFSSAIAKRGPAAFCASAAPQIEQVSDMDETQLRATAKLVGEKLCGGVTIDPQPETAELAGQ